MTITRRLFVFGLLAVISCASDDRVDDATLGDTASELGALCESRLDVCYSRADARYQQCLYGVELDYDYCVRNHGQNCEDNYQIGWDRCGDKLDTDVGRCELNYCICEGGTIDECSTSNG